MELINPADQSRQSYDIQLKSSNDITTPLGMVTAVSWT